MATIITSGTQKKATAASALPVNAWTHLAMTYNGARLLLFVNGVRSASKSTTGAMPNSTGPLRIGGTAVSSSQWFAGTLDELRVYNRALGETELQADMNAPVGPTDTQPPSTPANLRQTGSSATTAAVAWDPSTDNAGVQGYEVFKSEQSLGTTTATSWNVAGLPCGSTTPIGIEAFDSSGNRSPRAVIMAGTDACDTTPPTVSVTGPAAGSIVSGTVSLVASASDASGIAGVRFYVDGAAQGPEDQTAPYAVDWDSRQSPNGPRSITAVARDALGTIATSEAVAVNVGNDTTPPSVQLTAPQDGATVSGIVLLSAEAADNRGVAGVRFRLDGSDLQPEDTTAPYTLDWNSAGTTAGAHTLAAVARDEAGNTTTSTTRTVFVQGGLNTADAWKKVTVGPGYVDASTRTPVRTAGGLVYLFAADDTARGNGVGPTVIHAWKANQPGIPTAFSEQDAANRPTAALGSLQVLGSPDTRLDRSGVAHLVYMNESTDTLNYRTFSTGDRHLGPERDRRVRDRDGLRREQPVPAGDDELAGRRRRRGSTRRLQVRLLPRPPASDRWHLEPAVRDRDAAGRHARATRRWPPTPRGTSTSPGFAATGRSRHSRTRRSCTAVAARTACGAPPRSPPRRTCRRTRTRTRARAS